MPMATSNNPYEQRVIELQAQVDNLRLEIQNVTNLRNAAYNRQQGWAAAGQYDTAEYRAATQDYEGALQRLNVLQQQLNDLLAELEAARVNRDRVAAAAATAVANGLDPESALKQAVADQTRADGIKSFLKYAGLALLIIAIIWAFIWYKRKK